MRCELQVTWLWCIGFFISVYLSEWFFEHTMGGCHLLNALHIRFLNNQMVFVILFDFSAISWHFGHAAQSFFLFLSMAFSLASSGKHEWHSFQFSLITNSYYSKLKSFCIEHFTVDIYHAHASYKQWTVNTVHCELQFVMTFTICVYAVFFSSSSSSSWSLLLLLLLQCSWEKRMPNVFIRFEYRKLNAWKAYAICQCGVCNTQSKK